MSSVKIIESANDPGTRPTREEAENAVETLIKWIGDDAAREGLLDTPGRVVAAFEEYFAGYHQNPDEILGRVFEDIAGYDDFVLVKNITFSSHCEHHMAPIIGKASVAYWPGEDIVGISKLARIVDVYARRLVSQETMTRQIVETIDRVLKPKGTAIIIDAVHHCMATRGVEKSGSSTVTSLFSGIFKEDEAVRKRFMDSVHLRI